MVKLHDFEDRRHGLIIHALPIVSALNLGRNLIDSDKDLFNILQIAVVLTSQTLELLLVQFSLLSRLHDVVRQILSQLLLILGQCQNIGRYLIIFFLDGVLFHVSDPFVELQDLVCQILHQILHVMNFAIGQQIDPIDVIFERLLHFLRSQRSNLSLIRTAGSASFRHTRCLTLCHLYLLLLLLEDLLDRVLNLVCRGQSLLIQVITEDLFLKDLDLLLEDLD